MRTRQSGLIGVAVIAALFGTAAMATDQRGAKAVGEAAESVPVTFNGVQVYIDPKTGRLREPTATEREALSRALKLDPGARSVLLQDRPADEIAARATLRTSRAGTVGAVMQLPSNQINFLYATQQEDGSVAIGHDPVDIADANEDARGQEVSP